MYTKESTRRAMLKVVYIIPLIAFALTAFARPTWVEEVSQQLQTETEQVPLLSPTAFAEALRPTAVAEPTIEVNSTNRAEVAQEKKHEEELSDAKKLSETTHVIGEHQPTTEKE